MPERSGLLRTAGNVRLPGKILKAVESLKPQPGSIDSKFAETIKYELRKKKNAPARCGPPEMFVSREKGL